MMTTAEQSEQHGHVDQLCQGVSAGGYDTDRRAGGHQRESDGRRRGRRAVLGAGRAGAEVYFDVGVGIGIGVGLVSHTSSFIWVLVLPHSGFPLYGMTSQGGYDTCVRLVLIAGLEYSRRDRSHRMSFEGNRDQVVAFVSLGPSPPVQFLGAACEQVTCTVTTAPTRQRNIPPQMEMHPIMLNHPPTYPNNHRIAAQHADPTVYGTPGTCSLARATCSETQMRNWT